MKLQTTILYFAYGSNMLSKRIESRLRGRIESEGTFKLKGYRLVFNCGYEHSSFANIIPSEDENDFVEGVLFRLDSDQVNILDRYEGVPWHYEKHYFMIDGKIAYCYVSVSQWFSSRAKPDYGYLKILQEGALENDLAYTYNLLTKYEEDNDVRYKYHDYVE